MQVFYYEFTKLTAKKQLWIFLLILLAASLFFSGRQIQNAGVDTEGISQQEYDAYRTVLIQNAKQVKGVSLFSDETSFSYRNAGYIVSAYEQCADIEISKENPAGVQLLCDTLSTDVLAVVWILALLNWIVLEERKNGQFFLQRTTRNGRRYLGNAKLAVLVSMSLMGMAVLMLERFILAGAAYGLGDLNRSIQSVYPASVSHFNVWQVLVISFFIKCLICAVLTIALYLTTQIILNNRVLAVVWLVLLLGSLLAYGLIAENSWLALVKEINPWSYFNTALLFIRYKNLNIFNWPVSYNLVCAIVTGMLLVVSLPPSLFLYGRKNIFTIQGKRSFPEIKVSHTGIRRHEAYKLMTMGGWWLVFIMLLAGLYVIQDNYRIYTSEDEYYYWDYCSRLAGSWGEEQEAYLAAEAERFDDMLEMMGQSEMAAVAASTQYRIYYAYQKVCDQAKVLRTVEGGQLLYDKGYNYLLVQTNIGGYLRRGVLLLVLLLFSMSTVWEVEYRYDQMKLLVATRAGKKRIRKIKHRMCLIMGSFLYGFLMLELYVSIGRVYGYKGLTAPAACLPALSWVPTWISIIAYLAVQNLLLLLLTELVAMVIVKAFAYLFR